MIYDAFATVSGINFVDQDLDEAEIGGYVRWTEPVHTERVINYGIFLSTDAIGTEKSQIATESS
jgi:hypothetical protein